MIGFAVATPWTACDKPQQAAPSSSSSVAAVFNSSGKISNLLEMLKAQGFIEGAHINKKGFKEAWVIDNVAVSDADARAIKLRKVDESKKPEIQATSAEDLLANYEMVVATVAQDLDDIVIASWVCSEC